jgi:precorrin-6Y C5,15-methyltransferase (decarboxylating)
MRIAVFSGTSDGRRLCECLSRAKIDATVCVATAYGGAVMPSLAGITVREGRMELGEMTDFLREFDTVADATHPYAAVVSDNLRSVCAELGVRYLRLVRPENSDGDVIRVPTTRAAAEYLNSVTGSALITTGGKELGEFTAVNGFAERLFARILPDADGVLRAASLGFSGKHLICIQGPFSREMNAAMLRDTGAEYLVTKDTGDAGGLPEKLAAARETGARVVLISRPREETGYTLAQLAELLTGESVACDERVSPDLQERSENIGNNSRTFYIVGAGPGAVSSLTRAAAEIIARVPHVVATERVARALSPLRADIEVVPYSETLLRAAGKSGDTAVLVSGDAGFYSAAKTLAPKLAELGDVRVLPGIGSLQYFCARLRTSYDDAVLISLHGRAAPLLGAVSYNAKVLALTGGEHTAREICARLTAAGLGGVDVTIGENLSSDSERIFSGTAAEIAGDAELAVSDMAVVLVENRGFARADLPLRDVDFIRGDTPMTKEEVRWIVAEKLRIDCDATVYDIGAGTGSCAMEFARRACRGRVFAVERDNGALELIARNRVKTGAFNVEIVAAEAPDGLDSLPTPDCVFVGGSGGRLREILAPLHARNAGLRAVVTAITLETLHEATAVLEEIGFSDVEVSQITAARARKIGGYHMMTGQNPVFIISGGGV